MYKEKHRAARPRAFFVVLAVLKEGKSMVCHQIVVVSLYSFLRFLQQKRAGYL
jgi:hypothetical protein